MQWTRLAISGVTIAVCAAACADVLDIQDPKARPGEAGASGEPTTFATDSGGSSTTSGDGGASTRGGASQAGETVGGNAPDAGAGGEAGAPAMKDCEPNAVQCDAKSPQICDETGHWVANGEEADGECAVVCVAGECKECVDGTTRCTVCKDDDADCDSNLPQKCVAGVWTDEKKSCAQFCDAGGCVTTPSCGAATTTLTDCGGESCCKSFLVPGGTFKRDFDGSDDYGDDSFVANISPFLLDKFEVTVGRFRQFANAYAAVLDTALKPGAGKPPHVTDDAGWDSDFAMPADKTALLTEVTDAIKCSGDVTWSDDLASSNLPMNCVSFNVAYAFCIWDGGRLPTEAEWNFAAAGGADQRVYPWILPLSGPDITDAYANYGDAHPGPVAVGSTLPGNGRWGQADLAGNVSEWTLDYFGAYPTTCTDCLNTTAAAYRSVRGGTYASPADGLFVAVRFGLDPTTPRAYAGFRCARDPK